MRRVLIPLTVGLMFAGCDRQEGIPDEMPPAQIAPPSAEQKENEAEDGAAEEAPAAEAAEAEDAPERGAVGKGVGAAGCATPECEAACEGKNEPECAEAFAIGCFSDTPPDDARCAAFAAPSQEKADGKLDDALELKPKAKAVDGDDVEAKATPVGD